MKYLIVGLGNPGPEYARTRHNIGWLVLDELAGETPFAPNRLADVVEIKYRGRALVLVKPSTYMNRSGRAVQHWLQATKVPRENLLVLVDDLALPFGTLRLRGKGSDGGHNGLKDIQQHIGAQYPRLRLGIGAEFSQGQQVDYVLGEFDTAEQKALPAVRKAAAEAVQSFAFRGLGPTMTDFNRSVLPD